MKICHGGLGMSIALGSLALVSLSGCSIIQRGFPRVKNPVPSEIIYLHSVSSQDESLPMIAEWYSGEMKNWKSLKALNGNSTVFRIKPGTVIRIPADLLHQHEQMPAEFVSRKKNSYRIARKEPVVPLLKANESVSAAPPAEPDEPGTADELTAKDELIDNLLGSGQQGASELDRTHKTPSDLP